VVSIWLTGDRDLRRELSYRSGNRQCFSWHVVANDMRHETQVLGPNDSASWLNLMADLLSQLWESSVTHLI